MQRFKGRVVLLARAAGAIGRAIGARLGAEGASVIACDSITQADGAAVLLDVTQAESWAALAAQVEATQGHLDALVNCAGVLATGDVEHTRWLIGSAWWTST